MLPHLKIDLAFLLFLSQYVREWNDGRHLESRIHENYFCFRTVQLKELKDNLQLPNVLPSVSKQKKVESEGGSNTTTTPPPTPYGTPYIQSQLVLDNIASKLEKM